jgi:3-methyladenine DNA glycosylase AlkD
VAEFRRKASSRHLDRNAALQLAELKRLHELFEEHEIEYWLFGGWAVDFYVGVFTREHADLDIAVWHRDQRRIATLLTGESWTHVPEPNEDGYTAYIRDGVRLEVAFLAQGESGEVFTPLRNGQGSWPDAAFGDDVVDLLDTRARVISLSALKADKAESRDDPSVAAKDRLDSVMLSGLSLSLSSKPKDTEMKDRAESIENQLRAVGTSDRAVSEAKYLKSDLRFFGATHAEIRRAAMAVAKKGTLVHDDLIPLANSLWVKPVFELRVAAAILLGLHVKQLGADDLDMLERFIRDSKTWALVDVLSGDVIGAMNLKHALGRQLDQWARDDDFWIRRSSLLAELKPLKSGAAFEPFAKRADRMLEEKQFFIRKAIGWVLREMSKKRPDEVYEWVATRTHRISGVTIREVVKYLTPERSSHLMEAYKHKRPLR